MDTKSESDLKFVSQMTKNSKLYQWNRSSSLKLIELYEEHPCMYVSTRADFSNKHKRREAIEKITADLNKTLDADISADEVQKKINGLRTQFMEVHNKVVASQNNQDGGVYEPTLWCYDRLNFILPYIIKRKTVSNQGGHQSIMGFSPVYIKDSHAHLQIPKQELRPSTMYEGELQVVDDNILEYCPTDQSWESTSYTKSYMKRQRSSSPHCGDTDHSVKRVAVHDEHDIFAQFLVNEMRNFTSQTALKLFKRDVLKALMRAQEKDDEINDVL